MIVIDEAAHISLDLFYETIVPILELTNTALLAISTPLDEFNYYSELFLKKDENGEDFFKTIKAGRICDDCGRLPYDIMIKCDHVPDGAHWKSVHKKRRLAALFEGDEARGLRELGGIMASDHTPCFQKKDIATLFDNERYTLQAPPEAIYVTIDPNGGGASDFGMAAGCFVDGRLIVRNQCLGFYFFFSFSLRVLASGGVEVICLYAWISRANLSHKMLSQHVDAERMITRCVDESRVQQCSHLVP